MPHPDTPSAVEAVLRAILQPWGGSAPDPEGGAAVPPALYVDAFAGAEWCFGAVAPSRPDECRAGATALTASALGAISVLVEEDPALVARLRAALERSGAGARMRDTVDPSDAEPGAIVLLEGDFRDVVDSVAAVPPGTRTLVWAAPPAARRLPWTVLEGLLADPALDLLLRFPAADFMKQGALDGPLADLPPFARRLVEGCSMMLGDPRHAWLAAWRAAQRLGGPASALREQLDAFGERLQAHAEDRLVKLAPADPPLFLVTGSPAAALALNGVADASPVPAAAPAADAACDLFGVPVPAAAAPLDPVPLIAERLYAAHRGSEVSFAALVSELAPSDVSLEQLRGALRSLRRSGRASYAALDGAGRIVAFPPAPRERLPRRRRPREREIDLFTGGT